MLTYLQPENIVLREKEGRNINIIGFGSALKLDTGKKAMSNSTNLNAFWEFQNMSGSKHAGNSRIHGSGGSKI